LHLEQFSILLDDILRLHQTGMIRFFQDEIECGKTVGVDVLTVEERNIILRKLGAGKARPSKKTSGLNRTCTNRNEIWQQMRQQKLIFASIRKNAQQNVLPVRKHVEAVVLERLVQNIIQASSLVDHIPTDRLLNVTTYIKNAVQKSLQKRFISENGNYRGCCFRLREAPQLTLQRCARLYLCATSGPGEMRGSGTNGWRSVQPYSASNITNAPLAKSIPPPGQHVWHQVQYPGLSYCFGLTSASFLNSYKHLPCDDLSFPRNVFVEVFRTLEDFRWWEICAELRCTVDYLLELNEAMRYDDRRRARGKEPRHGNKDSSTPVGGSVDFLCLQTANGRKMLLQRFSRCSVVSDVERDVHDVLPSLEGDCEKVLGVIGTVSRHVLGNSNKNYAMLIERPWLRHMSWQACLALILFDVM
jgi:hypothetical protein